LSDFVTVEKPQPQVALVTLNRPERMNAMSFEVVVPFREALDAAAADNDVWAVNADSEYLEEAELLNPVDTAEVVAIGA